MSFARLILRAVAIAFVHGSAASHGAGVAPLPIRPDLVVAADGSGDFRSIHAAVQSIPRDNRERRLILVRNGVYTEQVRVDDVHARLEGTRHEVGAQLVRLAGERGPDLGDSRAHAVRWLTRLERATAPTAAARRC